MADKRKKQESEVKPILPKGQSFWRKLTPLGFILISFLIYGNTLNHGYVLDDIAAVGKNSLVQKGFEGIPDLARTGLFYGYSNSNEPPIYRPVSLISFAIEHGLWGDRPHRSHFINVLLFGLCCMVLFLLMQRLFGENRFLLSFTVTFLFATHPIHTEVVCNIKSRDEIFAFLFAALSFYALISHVQSKRLWQLLVGTICGFLAFLSKENAITYLAVIPVGIWITSQDKRATLKVFLYLLAATVSYLLLKFALFGTITIKNEIPLLDNVMVHATFLQRICTAMYVLGRYLLLLIIPYPLSYDYSFNQITLKSIGDWEVWASVFVYLFMAATAAYLIWKKKMPSVSLGIIAYIISLGVVSNLLFLIGSSMAERFLFLPSLGFCMALGGGLYYLLKLEQFDHLKSYEFKATNVGLLVQIIPCIFLFITFNRNPDWKDNYTLYKADVVKVPNSARAHYGYGTAIWDSSKFIPDTMTRNPFLRDALHEFQEALRIYPDYNEAKINLGNVYHDLGDFDNELNTLGKLNNKGGSLGQALFNAGNAFLNKGDYTHAALKFSEAIKNEFASADAYVAWAIALNSLGKADSAINSLTKALELNPNSPEAYVTLGSCYATKNDYKNAIDAFNKALILRPDYPEALANLGDALTRSGRYEEALKTNQKVLTIAPQITQVYFNMGYTYLVMQDYAHAYEWYKKYEQLVPQNPDVWNNLAYILQKQNKFAESANYYERYLNVYPNRKDIWQNLAFCYNKMGQKQKSLEALKKSK